uniref:non-specific serine/threonine protein kinase n=1 Tax=Meloidogyne hapla TaxID=6305 RepID=A0A1I8BM79_MELHA
MGHLISVPQQCSQLFHPPFVNSSSPHLLSQNSSNKSLEMLNNEEDEIDTHIPTTLDPSYGSVHKALHKSSGRSLAIKMVPVDTDLQEIIKEITIMQQCDSRHVVKYYGSYFKNSDLWIVMEYCGAGSVSDIMRLRRKILDEFEISAVLKDTLLGLFYLHGMKKIHRDIKAGNILLNMDGNAKLADFGVAGQITDTMAKRNTVIGTPFWMAPELIQEVGYDMKADIWSLGITAIEMAEGRPPHAEIHPMRAIFMIPTKPPPTLKVPQDWSPLFLDLISKCLVKNPEERTTAKCLLEHEFIKSAKGAKVLREMIANAQDVAAQYLLQEAQYSHQQQTIQEFDTNSTMVTTSERKNSKNSLINSETMGSGINNNNDTMSTNFDDGTLIQYGESIRHELQMTKNNNNTSLPPPPYLISNGNNSNNKLTEGMNNIKLNEDETSANYNQASLDSNVANAFKRAMNGQGDYSFLQELSTDELLLRKERLEKEMEAELRELQARYHAKRKAILDAISLKKNGTVQF